MGSVSRVSVKGSLSHVLNCCSYTLISQLKPKFNNVGTKKPFHEFTFKNSSNFFLCVRYFSRKKHLSNLPVRNEFTELLFSTCSRYCWNYCHFIFSRSCFWPEVSLSIIVKCNVNCVGQSDGSEMEDHVQPTRLVFITMVEWFPRNLKEVRVLVNALSVVKSFYFYMKFSRLIQIIAKKWYEK